MYTHPHMQGVMYVYIHVLTVLLWRCWDMLSLHPPLESVAIATSMAKVILCDFWLVGLDNKKSNRCIAFTWILLCLTVSQFTCTEIPEPTRRKLAFLKPPAWREHMERLRRGGDRCLRSPKCCSFQRLSCSQWYQIEQRPDVPNEPCFNSRFISKINVAFVMSHCILGWLVVQH